MGLLEKSYPELLFPVHAAISSVVAAALQPVTPWSGFAPGFSAFGKMLVLYFAVYAGTYGLFLAIFRRTFIRAHARCSSCSTPESLMAGGRVAFFFLLASAAATSFMWLAFPLCWFSNNYEPVCFREAAASSYTKRFLADLYPSIVAHIALLYFAAFALGAIALLSRKPVT